MQLPWRVCGIMDVRVATELLKANRVDGISSILALPAAETQSLAVMALESLLKSCEPHKWSTEAAYDAQILGLCFHKVEVSERVVQTSTLSSFKQAMQCHEFGVMENDASLIKAVNNAVLAHEDKLLAWLEMAGYRDILNLLLKTAPPVHDEVRKICASFMHRMCGMFKAARVTIAADGPALIQLTDLTISLQSADIRNDADTHVLSELTKCLYALLVEGWPHEELCVQGLRRYVSCVASMASRCADVDQLFDTAAQILMLFPIEELIRCEELIHCDASAYEAFATYVLHKINAFACALSSGASDDVDATALQAVTALQVACKLAQLPDGSAKRVFSSRIYPLTPEEMTPEMKQSLQTFHDDVKVMVEELAWIVFDENPGTLIKRMGIGYCAGLLQRKSVIDIPE